MDKGIDYYLHSNIIELVRIGGTKLEPVKLSLGLFSILIFHVFDGLRIGVYVRHFPYIFFKRNFIPSILGTLSLLI
jgi:hypothetical protein